MFGKNAWAEEILFLYQGYRHIKMQVLQSTKGINNFCSSGKKNLYQWWLNKKLFIWQHCCRCYTITNIHILKTDNLSLNCNTYLNYVGSFYLYLIFVNFKTKYSQKLMLIGNIISNLQNLCTILFPKDWQKRFSFC